MVCVIFFFFFFFYILFLNQYLMPVNRRVNSLCAQKIVLPFIDMH